MSSQLRMMIWIAVALVLVALGLDVAFNVWPALAAEANRHYSFIAAFVLAALVLSEFVPGPKK